jgi:hypothetical protein
MHRFRIQGFRRTIIFIGVVLLIFFLPASCLALSSSTPDASVRPESSHAFTAAGWH